MNSLSVKVERQNLAGASAYVGNLVKASDQLLLIIVSDQLGY